MAGVDDDDSTFAFNPCLSWSNILCLTSLTSIWGVGDPFLHSIFCGLLGRSSVVRYSSMSSSSRVNSLIVSGVLILAPLVH